METRRRPLLVSPATMTHPDPNASRDELRFPSAVREHFRFLEVKGFQLRESNPTYARYARGDLVIEIYHGRQSYELGLNLIRGGISYSLQNLMGAHNGAGGSTNFRPFAATDPHGVALGVERLAQMFESCSEYYLNDEPSVYRALDDYGNAVNKRLALDSLARQLRPKAEAAFKIKNYRLAADLYDQIRERLTPAEVAKLNFAKSRS